jgi:uncharacterized delta-60 repeat protein
MPGLKIDEDGKIYSAGRVVSGFTGSSLWMYKLNIDGSLDNSFDLDGKLFIGNEGAFCLAVDDTKKAIVSVSDQNGDILRLNEDGSFDNTFDSDGYKSLENSQSNAMCIDNNGKIISAGFGLIPNDGVSTGIDIFRLNNDGSFDDSFNGTGKNHHTLFIDESAPRIKKILLGSDNMYLTGYNNCEGCGDICTYPNQLSPCNNIMGSGTKDFVIMCLSSSDGSLNQVFNNDGIAIIPVVPGNTDEAFDAAIDANGNIVMVGFTERERAAVSRDIAIIRVLGSSATAIKPSEEKSKYKLYPNPGNGQYSINLPMGKKIEKLTLRNVLGEPFEISAEQKGEELLINLKELPEQLYLLELTEESGASQIIKIVKN